MTRPIICSSCKKHDSVYNEKTKSYYKTCDDCRKKRGCRTKQASSTPNNEGNISTKSSTQQSQS